MTRSTHLKTLRLGLRAALLGAGLGLAGLGVSWAEEPAVVAGPMDRDALVKAIEARFKDVVSLKAKFTQVLRSEVFGDETESGEVSIKRPAMMRWQYGTDKQFISNGKKLWVYTAADKSVIEYDDIASGRSSADQFLTSLDRIGEFFEIKVLESTAEGHRIMLTPRKDSQFKTVEMSLTSSLMPKKIIITDPFDAVTELSFEDVALNAEIPDSRFEFSAPPGVDVIKATN